MSHTSGRLLGTFLALVILSLALVGCDDPPPRQHPRPELSEFTLAGTIEKIDSDDNVLFRGLDNQVTWLETCNKWAVETNHSYKIEVYHDVTSFSGQDCLRSMSVTEMVQSTQ